ncbi:hypothetical protein EI94DRAFT_1709676 [Lactarius quietus]|nr:hypothetical protein EI94DRAFT_1709676 [Lactarius quietus]
MKLCLSDRKGGVIGEGSCCTHPVKAEESIEGPLSQRLRLGQENYWNYLGKGKQLSKWAELSHSRGMGIMAALRVDNTDFIAQEVSATRLERRCTGKGAHDGDWYWVSKAGEPGLPLGTVGGDTLKYAEGRWFARIRWEFSKKKQADICYDETSTATAQQAREHSSLWIKSASGCLIALQIRQGLGERTHKKKKNCSWDEMNVVELFTSDIMSQKCKRSLSGSTTLPNKDTRRDLNSVKGPCDCLICVRVQTRENSLENEEEHDGVLTSFSLGTMSDPTTPSLAHDVPATWTVKTAMRKVISTTTCMTNGAWVVVVELSGDGDEAEKERGPKKGSRKLKKTKLVGHQVQILKNMRRCEGYQLEVDMTRGVVESCPT